MLDELTHVVQCRETSGSRWETIAAFNVYKVARRYADDCWASNRGLGLEYRVREIER